MTDSAIEQSLIHYAHSVATDELAPFSKEYPAFNNIIDDLANLDSDPNTEAMNSEQANSYLVMPPSGPDDIIGDHLTPTTAEKLHKIAHKILDILATTNMTSRQHKSLQRLCGALWPLYSRHSATNMIGFDLQEYADYFESITSDEKTDLANKLRTDWDN